MLRQAQSSSPTITAQNPSRATELLPRSDKRSGDGKHRQGNQHAYSPGAGLSAAGHGRSARVLPARDRRQAIRKAPAASPARRPAAARQRKRPRRQAVPPRPIVNKPSVPPPRTSAGKLCDDTLRHGVPPIICKKRWGYLADILCNLPDLVASGRCAACWFQTTSNSARTLLLESYQPRYLAAFARSAARSVFSQVNSGSLRPKWPPEAVF